MDPGPSGPSERATAAARRRRIRWLQRYLLNPPVRLLVRLGLVPGYVLLETTGRVTGKRRRTVVGAEFVGDTGWVVAEQGRHAGYVRNIEACPNVRVCRRALWRDARAILIPGDNPLERLDSFHRRLHAATVRRFGTDLMTLRLDLS